jgi:Na+/melibiose symporter-like transporter
MNTRVLGEKQTDDSTTLERRWTSVAREQHRSIRKAVRRFAVTMVVFLLIMAVVLVLGRLAGGAYWVAAVVFCIVAYVALTARGAVFRQKLARWQSQRHRAHDDPSQSDTKS